MWLREYIRKNHKIFIKFCIVGLINTFIHYFLAITLIKSGYSFFLANLGGFSCALVNSFYLNAIFTFKKPINFNAFQRFLLLSLGGFLATLLVDNISSNVLLSDQNKVIFAIIVVLPVNYILLKSFVYKA
jgi:putative flippase GtrA|tara:strand:- start:1151 stop:1540 length:390 start_codon:yes stop_codon:yes gene_type:complete